MGLAREIAEFVVSLDLVRAPPEVAEKIDGCLLNGYGIALGGVGTRYRRVAADAAIEAAGQRSDGATLLFDGRRTGAAEAMVANAALFHGRAQEDTCGTVHMGAIAIPLLTALAEAGGYPLGRMKPALLAAYEVSGLFDLAYGRITAPARLRATPLYGTIGAAAAAGRMMGLTVDQMESALSNAASFTGGILQSFAEGSEEWRYQVGIAARNGWTAALLARHGSVSAREAFEGPAGFVRAYAREACDPAALRARLGSDWSVLRVTYKPYPVCAFNQTPVIAALALRERLAGRRPDRVRVRMNPYETSYAGMDSYGPFDSISGTLMSIPFCIATALLHGAPDMRRMTTYDDPEIAALMRNIVLVTDEAVPNLSTVIEADIEGETLMQDQRMTAADYAYDWSGVSALVRRIGAEQGIGASIYDRLEHLVRTLPEQDIAGIVDLFDPAFATGRR